MDTLFIDVMGQAVIAILIVVPLWKIFSKAGKNPALSLFVFLPFLGIVLVGLILAFSNWPATANSAARGK